MRAEESYNHPVADPEFAHYDIKKVHISELRPCDTVWHNGNVRTVGGNIKRSEFMGLTLFGDSYRLGYMPVIRIIIHNKTT